MIEQKREYHPEFRSIVNAVTASMRFSEKTDFRAEIMVKISADNLETLHKVADAYSTTPETILYQIVNDVLRELRNQKGEIE